MSLPAKFVEIMKVCGTVKKTGWNDYHKFHYASAKDVLEMVNQACAERGIATIVTPQIIDVRDIFTSKGTKDVVVTVQTTVKLVESETGEVMELTGIASCADGGTGTATMRASTTSLKYAWMLSLQMAQEDMDVEQVTGQGEPAKENSKPATTATTATRQKNNPPPATTTQTKSAAPTSPTTAPVGGKCTDCGIPIADNVASYSKNKFGKHLCMNCQKKHRQAS